MNLKGNRLAVSKRAVYNINKDEKKTIKSNKETELVVSSEKKKKVKNFLHNPADVDKPVMSRYTAFTGDVKLFEQARPVLYRVSLARLYQKIVRLK